MFKYLDTLLYFKRFYYTLDIYMHTMDIYFVWVWEIYNHYVYSNVFALLNKSQAKISSGAKDNHIRPWDCFVLIDG